MNDPRDATRSPVSLVAEQDVRSRAAIAGHPIHPMLIPFPIAFLIGALATDIAFLANGEIFWAQASFWLIAAGFLTGLLAAVFGIVDFLGIKRVRRLPSGVLHALTAAAVIGVSLINFIIRRESPGEAIMPLGLTLSAVSTVLLLIAGWLGGEMPYRHGIAVTPKERPGQPRA